ncbi:hypothetical protein J22TS3_09700 [Paenibacillus sp. J22TS3]|nr:hypothetical protein J22TS3_09700 [Paenibacillus sp. J22TS3]
MVFQNPLQLGYAERLLFRRLLCLRDEKTNLNKGGELIYQHINHTAAPLLVMLTGSTTPERITVGTILEVTMLMAAALKSS